METESLSRYENNRDADLTEGNADNESSVDADVQQDKAEDSKSGDKETIDCDEQTCTTDKELNLETESKKDFTTYESDVEEEEEEDVPLNINADKSDEDSDGGDENLEDSDRDENEDAEKEDISEHKSEDGTEQLQHTSDVVDSDKPASVEGNDTLSSELKQVSPETVLVSDDENTELENSKAKSPSDTDACKETEQSSEDILNKPGSSQDNNDILSNEVDKCNETILLSDDETSENEKPKEGTSGTEDNKDCVESEQASDVLDKSESVINEDNDAEKKENEQEDVLDKSEPVTSKDDVISNESVEKVAEITLSTEDEAVTSDKSEKVTNGDKDNKDSEPQSSEKLETIESMKTTESSDNPPEENVQSQKGDSESDNAKTSENELLEDKPVEVANDNNENCTKIAENKNENEIITVDNSNDKKGDESLANGEKSDVMEIMDLTNDDDNKPKEIVPVKRRRRRRQLKNLKTAKAKRNVTVDRDPLEINPNEDLSKNLNEAEAEDDLDEDFDPSLFCPDINMEIEEAPVITNSDLPPGSADGSRSPALLDAVFSTYVDEVTGAEVDFNLTPEEEALRRETFGEQNPVQFTRVHCTACNMHLGSALDGQGNRFVHPLLKVLICKNCYHFYTSGEFEKDEDGSELYCRWCGQGGQVMCCSNCEMVFCKKCIRINFDKKKMAEIRDSEDWICFRCNPSQLIPQRIHCAEFMEYVRTETMRASTLENSTQFMTTDHSQCCNTLKRKATDQLSGEVKKRKRKPREDPDYNPLADRVSPVPSTSGTTPKLVPIVPNPMDINQSVTVAKVAAPNAAFKIGSTTFRPQAVASIRPRGPFIPSLPNQVPGQNSPRQMFKLIPNVGLTRTPSPRVGFTSTRQPAPSTSTGPATQTHEWFDKTVVATARVNSNLSYTLSQLNQTQAKATTVQALAVVHNKLQEILSNSINALIQIRKNLRVEFIAGIRNARFPAQGTPSPLPKVPISSKPVAAAAAASAQDDDVILVTPPTEPIPSPLQKPKKQIPIKLPASVSLFKKTPTKAAAPDKQIPGPSSTGTPFLRVKSLTALQSVPSECITIPDDEIRPPAKVEHQLKAQPVEMDPPICAPVVNAAVVSAVVVNGTGTEKSVKKVERESVKKVETELVKKAETELVEKVETNSVENNHPKIKVKKVDLKKPLSREVKQMMEVKVVVPKLTIMEKKIQNELKKVGSESKDRGKEA